jgi:hypothetical protein
MQTTSRPTASLEAKPAGAPKIANLREKLQAETAKPTIKGVAEMEAAMDAYAASLTKREPPHVLGGHFDFSKQFATIVKDRVSIGWPPGLFIPGTADYKQYWILPPAPGKNRYDHGFAGGNVVDGNIFDPATGNLFAHAASLPTDPFLRSEAGIGFLFTPKTKLATYNVEATVSLNGQHKYDVSTEANAGGTVAEWGGLYVQAWDVSPVDGSTTAASGYGVATLFGQNYSNLQGGPNPTPTDHFAGTVTGNIMMEGGHTYLVTATAVTQIQNAWTMNNGAPMQAIPAGDLWKVWTWIGGIVSQVWVQPNVVYIP